ncbi:hypothetical protein [Tautonia sociabilis]|uniref:Uncharacterized protein n=1 Tax=Tautonia sociabilis TaxID=2080755 RepID=A0A432MK54_9BACT|nr:hypothetical protein [Tautonia sociabilis]RUL87781.1 hypothetical protein TsocGM_10485 [Tautonia sociabilis]
MHRIELGLAAIAGVLLVATAVAAVLAPDPSLPGPLSLIGLAATLACLVVHLEGGLRMILADGRIRRLDPSPSGRFRARSARNLRRSAPIPVAGLLPVALAWVVAWGGGSGAGWEIARVGAISAAVGYHLAALAVSAASVAGQRALLGAAEAESRADPPPDVPLPEAS